MATQFSNMNTPGSSGLGDLVYVTVHNTYVDIVTGAPKVGTISFLPSTRLYDVGADAEYLPNSFTVTLDANGAFSISLPATDASAIHPTSWTYQVTENLSSQAVVYSLAVPSASAPSVGLTTLREAQGA